jgi:acyl carrier protein
LFLEVGPGRTLATLTAQQTADEPVATIAGMESSNDVTEYQSVLKALGQLWLNGIEPNWNAFYTSKRKRLRLPPYAFDHKKYWVEPVVINQTGTVNYQPEEIVPDEPQTNSEENIIQNNIMRKDLLADKLYEIFEDSSGIEIEKDAADLSFPEIGFDSLLLTQIATNLKKHLTYPLPLGNFLRSITLLTCWPISWIKACPPGVRARTNPTTCISTGKRTAPGANAKYPVQYKHQQRCCPRISLTSNCSYWPAR